MNIPTNTEFSLKGVTLLALLLIVTACSDSGVDSNGESENLKRGLSSVFKLPLRPI